MLKVLLKDSYYYLLGNIFAQVTGLLTIVAGMRALSINDFGVYSYALAFVTFFSFVADGGLSQYLIKEISQNEERIETIYRKMQGLQLLLSLGIMTLLTIIAALIHTQHELTVIIILGLGAIINGYASPVFSTLIAQGRRELILRKDLTISLVKLTYLASFLAYGPSLFYFASINLICSLSALVYSLSIKRNKEFSYILNHEINRMESIRIISEGLPYSILMFANILYNKIDILMLKYMSGDNEVAVYSGATQFVYPFMFVSTVLANSVFPHLSRNVTNISMFNNIRNNAAIIMSCVGFAISTILFATSNIFIDILFKGKYDSSLTTYHVLVWYLFIVFSYGAFSNALVARGGIKAILKLTTAMLFLNIGLNSVLIKHYGAVGAAFATLACEIIIFVCVTILSLRCNRTNHKLAA